ncbi:DUF5691 domain-containing protein [Xanthomonas bonasiae]|uniref:DUF5691 domain-containing protein n=1 Tax=Xanthomonas bonasiae TaxID=2810351 RepID=UPI00177BBDE7|nr:DUF5691 domain-containing protein [Xanthomonas surreyensis]MBD7920744.1 hypothetical protein [Xanthomonas surreyensis]
MNEAWLKPALLGIDRAQAIPAEGALGEVLAAVATQEDAALGYSRQVGVLAACRRAALRMAAPVALPPPAEVDPLVLPAGHAWAPLLKGLFSAAQPSPWMKRARYEACAQLAARNRHLPVAVLPQALEAGARLSALRPGLRPVLGVRGRWLAACNADWAYAAETAVEADAPADLEQMWNEGAFDARLLAFRQLRAHNPEDARARLQGTLKDLSARERVDFVAALQPQLSEADAPLLQPLLKDRSREVRLLAGPMLARLPSTPHAQYVQAQMRALLRHQPGGLMRRTTWTLEAPAAADAGWADAAIDSKRPNNDLLGERAWWLYQLARQLPLAWWCHTLEKAPAQVLAWARSTDWYDALLRAWLERVDASEPEWVEALIGVEQRHMSLGDLLAMLPPTQRERHWPTSATELQQKRLFGEVLDSTGLGQTLSAAYSRQLAAGLGALFGEEFLRHDYTLRDALLELLAVLDPSALSQVQVADAPADATEAMRDCVHQARQLLALRQALRSAF